MDDRTDAEIHNANERYLESLKSNSQPLDPETQ